MNLSQFIGPQGTSGYLGGNAVQRALDAGLSLGDVQRLAQQQGLQISAPAAQQYYAPPPSSNNGGGGGIKALIRDLMEGGITRSEIKSIAEQTGASYETIVKRIDAINQSAQDNGKKPPVALNAGAANLLINQASGAPSYAQLNFGSGSIGQTLQSMAGSPGYTAQRSVNGGAMGGSYAATPAQMMIGGTQIRPGGKVAVKKPQVPMAAPAAPAPVVTDPTAPVGGDTGGWYGDGGFNFQGILDALMGMTPEEPMMPMMPMMPTFEDISSDFDFPDPVQLAALGKAYGGDMIRARQRQRKTRTDYLRNQINNMTLGGLGGGLAPMMIGGGLTL